MTEKDCIFCKILREEIPSDLVFENEKVIAFNDLHPQSKTHILFIHKKHTCNINEIATDKDQLADIFMAIKHYTESTALAKDGFRVVTNLGPNGRQSVFHTHFHVLGGETLGGFGR